MSLRHLLCIPITGLFCIAVLPAQTRQPIATTTAVPRLVRVNSSFHPASGSTASAIESATLSIYASETGGTALWQEMQNVAIDNDGHYSLLLGSTHNEGLPLDLFASGEPRWLGVQFQRPGEVEQPRVLLASVPYALKAADAETLGGQPLSSFVLANPATSSNAATSTSTSLLSKPPLPRISSGTPGYIGQFSNTTDLVNSVMYQNLGMIGLGTVSPLDYMHVQFTNTSGTVTGYAVQNLGNTNTSYSGTLFYDQNGSLGQFQGFNNVTHEYRINNIAKTGGTADGSINFMLNSSSKFLVRSDGDVDIPGSIRKSGILFLQTSGGPFSTALGLSALAVNTGSNNTAVGYQALLHNTSANYNSAFGTGALAVNTTGFSNTAIGNAALGANMTGNSDIAVGGSALAANTIGATNIAIGRNALGGNTSGNVNIGIGDSAGMNITTTSNNIMIGHQGVSGDDHTIRIGDPQTNTYIAGITGVMVSNSAPVLIDTTTGHLGTIVSSRRYKEDIQDMAESSTNLLRLRPVTYRYKQPYADGSKPLDYGLVAEEVAEIYPDLVARNKDGQIETVQYQKLTPMLLNELQKQSRRIEELEAKLAAMSALESRVAALEPQQSNKSTTTSIAAR